MPGPDIDLSPIPPVDGEWWEQLRLDSIETEDGYVFSLGGGASETQSGNGLTKSFF